MILNLTWTIHSFLFCPDYYSKLVTFYIYYLSYLREKKGKEEGGKLSKKKEEEEKEKKLNKEKEEGEGRGKKGKWQQH